MTESLPTPGFFTSALGAYDNSNPFDHAFRDEDDQRKNLDFDHGTSDVDFFGFSPRASPRLNEGEAQVRAPMYQHQDLDGMDLSTPNGWIAPRQMFTLDQQSVQEDTLPHQTHSPAKQWDVDLNLHQTLSLNKLVTQVSESTTKVEHGQITPQSDASPERGARRGGRVEPEASANPGEENTNGRRRQSSQAIRAAAPANSNRRKTSNASKSITSDAPDNDDEEVDEKRSKFLERNRVAASKCRQKKKEWTNNLEQRARELQSNKAQLAMMVGALKEEMLYLKGEVLKHNNCNCTTMREYLNREVQSISQQIPHAYALPQAMGSTTLDSPAKDDMEVDQRSHSSRQGSMSQGAASPAADQELRALLTTEIQTR